MGRRPEGGGNGWNCEFSIRREREYNTRKSKTTAPGGETDVKCVFASERVRCERVDWKGKQVPTCQTRDFRLSGTVSDAT